MTKTISGKTFEDTTIARFFHNPAFGIKSVRGQEGTAFVSEPLTQDGLEKIKALGVGAQFVMKRSPNLNAKGNYTYFFEYLAPRNTTTDTGI